jgi:hypothetical protein
VMHATYTVYLSGIGPVIEVGKRVGSTGITHIDLKYRTILLDLIHRNVGVCYVYFTDKQTPKL